MPKKILTFALFLTANFLTGSEYYLEIIDKYQKPMASMGLLEELINGDLEKAKRCLELGADPNIKRPNGFSPLYLAIAGNRLDLINLLLEWGADIDLAVGERASLLHLAAGAGYIDRIKLILETDPDLDINRTDIECRTPLHWAAGAGHIEILKLLIEQGADYNFTDNGHKKPVYLAAYYGHWEIVQYIFALREEQESIINFEDQKQVLLHAAMKGHIKIAKKLLDKINLKELDKTTREKLFGYPAQVGDVDFIKMLLDYGLELEAKLKNSFYGMAIDNNDAELVEFLIDNGVDKDLEIVGLTTLGYAVSHGKKNTVELLLKRGADPNRHNNYNVMPLTSAARRGKTEIINLLIDYGAKLEHVIDSKMSAIQFATMAGLESMVEEIIINNPDWKELPDFRGAGSLYFAVDMGHKNIVEMLLAHGADPNTESSLDEIDLDILTLLLSYGADLNSIYTSQYMLKNEINHHSEKLLLLLANGLDIHNIDGRNMSLQTFVDDLLASFQYWETEDSDDDGYICCSECLEGKIKFATTLPVFINSRIIVKTYEERVREKWIIKNWLEARNKIINKNSHGSLGELKDIWGIIFNYLKEDIFKINLVSSNFFVFSNNYIFINIVNQMPIYNLICYGKEFYPELIPRLKTWDDIWEEFD